MTTQTLDQPFGVVIAPVGIDHVLQRKRQSLAVRSVRFGRKVAPSSPQSNHITVQPPGFLAKTGQFLPGDLYVFTDTSFAQLNCYGFFSLFLRENCRERQPGDRATVSL